MISGRRGTAQLRKAAGEIFQAALDAADPRVAIQRHLRRCPPCTDGFSFESKLQQRIREDCVDDMSEELMARLTTFIRQNGPTDTSVDPTAGGSAV